MAYINCLDAFLHNLVQTKDARYIKRERNFVLFGNKGEYTWDTDALVTVSEEGGGDFVFFIESDTHGCCVENPTTEELKAILTDLDNYFKANAEEFTAY